MCGGVGVGVLWLWLWLWLWVCATIHSGGFFLGVQFVLANSGIPYALEDSTATYLLTSVLE
jgi:hypothetical protein